MLDLGQDDRIVLDHHRELVAFGKLKVTESEMLQIELDLVVLVDLWSGRTLHVHALDFVEDAIIADQPQDVLLERLLVSNPKLRHDFIGWLIVLDALPEQGWIVLRFDLGSLGGLIVFLRHAKTPCWICTNKYL